MLRYRTFYASIIIVVCCLHATVKAAAPLSAKNYSSSFAFIENKGQVLNQYHQVNNDVLYVFRTAGMQVQLRKSGFSYEIIKLEPKNKTFNENGPVADEMPVPRKHLIDQQYTSYIHRVDMLFDGASKDITIKASDRGQGYLNYYTEGTGGAGIDHVAHFRKIIYGNVYPGIDVEFLIVAGSFKYNFIVHPGAKTSDIRLRLLGAKQSSLTASGSIGIETAYGNIDERIPYSYQPSITGNPDKKTEREVSVGFVQLACDLYGLKTGALDPTADLVIDPSPWATYFGGTGSDAAGAITADINADVIMVGNSSSAATLATSGAYQVVVNGGPEGYILKVNPAGTTQWATYYGGSGDDYFASVSTDASANILAVGYTNSLSSIASSGAYQSAVAGGYDGTVVLFSGSGTRLWATYLGGALNDFVYDVSADLSGNVIICGVTSSTSGIATSGAAQTTLLGSQDAFIAKFSGTGSLLWSTYFGGSAGEGGTGVGVDLSGNIYMGGTTSSGTGIATSGAYQTTLGGSQDGFIIKYSPLGLVQWATYFGGSGSDAGDGAAVDFSGNIFIGGRTTSTTGLATAGAPQTTSGGFTDLYFAKFGSTGSLQWCTYLGGSSQDYAEGVACDPAGNGYISGYVSSSSGIASSGAYQATVGGGYDACFAKYTASGSLVWSTYFGGSSADQAVDICADGNGNAYGCGYSNSSGLATIGQTTNNGLSDAFIFAFPNPSSSGPITGNTITADQALCMGSTPSLLQGSFPGGGDGSFIYTWMESTSGIDGTFTPANGSNGGIDYMPPSLSSTMYYRRIVVSGAFADTSNMVVISVSTLGLRVGFTINKQIQCIRGNQFVFTDTTSGGPLTRLWTFSNGFTSTQPSEVMSFTFNVANSYTVKLVNSIAGACADSMTKTIYLTNNPVTGSISGNIYVERLTTVTYSVPANIGSSYKWFFDSGTGTSTTNSIKIKWTVTGVATVKVLEISAGGCPGDTVMLTVFIGPSVGIDESMEADLITVFPNPTNGMVNVSGFNMKSIMLYDMQGRLVYSNAQPLSDEHIDLGSFNNGMYMLDITDENDRIQHHKIELIK